MPRFLTSKRCGWTRSWPCRMPISGLVLQKEGQLSDALVWLKKAVELEPANVDFWQWLAELHDEMEESAESIPCWERVVALDPDRASAHLSLGWALQDESRFAEAREHYDAAIQLQPDFAAAYLNLGGLQEELGDMAAAERSFRTALEKQPAYALPHARLATLLRSKLPEADLAALEERLKDDKLAESPRARLLFALAHALDGKGEYARAAECLRESNALTHRDQSHPSRLRPGRSRAIRRRADPRRSIATCSRGSRAPGRESRRPVFVFGLPRSGTTLIEQVLASHSQVHGAGELRLARRSFEAIPGVLGRTGAPRDCVSFLDHAAVMRLAETHLERLAAIDGGRSSRVVDKMPDNYMYIGLLSIMFPRATFIHCRRDLRDIAVSCWMTDFRSIRWSNDQKQHRLAVPPVPPRDEPLEGGACPFRSSR